MFSINNRLEVCRGVNTLFAEDMRISKKNLNEIVEDVSDIYGFTLIPVKVIVDKNCTTIKILSESQTFKGVSLEIDSDTAVFDTDVDTIRIRTPKRRLVFKILDDHKMLYAKEIEGM